MADDADIASEYMTRMMEMELNKRQHAEPAKLGPEFCHDCGESIPLARRQLGSQRCIDCAEAAERRDSQFASH